MQTLQRTFVTTMTFVLCVATLATGAAGVQAHCDAEDGPVARAAREALDLADFSKIQIWVGEDQEAELHNRYQECLAVRQQGDRAKTLADRYFVETAIRLHREAEGMPFTGVKPAGPLPPDIAAAERALENGEVEEITGFLNEALNAQVSIWFNKALHARQARDESVEAGREWVDAYVKYVIYVHGLYGKIQAGPAHGVGQSAE